MACKRKSGNTCESTHIFFYLWWYTWRDVRHKVCQQFLKIRREYFIVVNTTDFFIVYICFYNDDILMLFCSADYFCSWWHVMKCPGAYINGKSTYLSQSLQSIKFFWTTCLLSGVCGCIFIFRKLGFVHFWSLKIANFPESGHGLISEFKNLDIILLNTIKLLCSQTPCIVDVEYPKI